MKVTYTFLVFLLSSFFLIAQEVQLPVLSATSGFYENEFTLTISHPDTDALIIYTLDGSDPHLDNIGGVTYNYKISYPQDPEDPLGSLLQNSFETLTYSNPIQITDRSNEPNKTSAIPTTFLTKTHFPPQTPVFKGTIVKARAVVDSEYSDIVVRNYFVTPQGADKYTLPVVSINLDEDKYYSYEYGLNVAGELFDQWRIANPTAQADIWTDANYWASGGDSELEINFSYFENGVEILNHNAGLRNHGNGSRHMPNRSIRLYAKGDYGVSKFNHSFFNDYNYSSFKRIILRNSGNDGFATLFRDAFIQQATKHLNFEIQEYQPVILFVNSEYSGIYNIRERYDDHYFDRVFEIDEDDLDFMENDGIVDVRDDVHYNTMMNYLENNSLSDNSNFEYVTTLIDPINYTDYYITNIFSANYDWPHNNYEFFRKRVSYTPDVPYGQDGRWRWVLKDMDFGFDLYQNNDYTHNTLTHATKFYEPWEWEAEAFNRSTLLARRLLENDEYKNYFINRFADLLNTTFMPSRLMQKMSEMEAVLEPEINEHIHRWDMFSYNDWQNNIGIMEGFATERLDYQRQHIRQKFNIDSNVQVMLDVSNSEHGYVKINTIDILPTTEGVSEVPYPWEGVYFKNIPISITAVPSEGYEFSHWEGTETGNNPELTISPEGGIYAKAIFVEDGLEIGDYERALDVTIFPNPFDDIIYLITDQYGFEYAVYSMDGKLIRNGILNNLTLDFSGLQKGIYILKVNTEQNEIIKKIIKK
ncbi:MAG: CotH kinase family protein [Flavobacteriaceae bacterium]